MLEVLVPISTATRAGPCREMALRAAARNPSWFNANQASRLLRHSQLAQFAGRA